MKVLYISFFFPPYNCIASVRSGKLTKWLHRQGADLRIVSGHAAHLPATLPFEIPDDHILRVTGFVDLDDVVRRTIARVRSGIMHSSQKNDGVDAGKLEKWYRSFLHWPDGQVAWRFSAEKKVLAWLEGWKPDVIFASSFPVSSLLLGRALSRRLGRPWVAEFRDLWFGNHYLDFLPSWRQRLDRKWEKRLLESASGLVTVSNPLADLLKDRHGKPVLALPNGWDPDDLVDHDQRKRRDLLSESNCDSKIFRVVYTGILYGEKQDVAPLFDAIRSLSNVHVAFYGRQFSYARAMARKFKVGEKVSFHPPVPRDESLALQRSADAVLLVLWNDPREKGVFTGKLFEYLASGRPILAIGPQDNVAAQLILRLGAGAVATSAEEVLQILRRWQEERPAGVSRENIMEWSHPRLALRLSKFLHEVIKV